MFVRWSRRTIVRAIVLLLCIAAMLSVLRDQRRQIAALRAEVGARAAVVVAGRDDDRGTRLVETDLTVASLPATFLPPGAAATIGDVVGRTLVADIAAGEVLTATRTGVRAGPVASQVPLGLRGFVVATQLPPGVLRPGDRVDVLATFGGQRSYTETVARDLEVLSVIEPLDGAAFGTGSIEPVSVVVLVGPDTAERLAYAVAFGQVALAVAGAGVG